VFDLDTCLSGAMNSIARPSCLTQAGRTGKSHLFSGGRGRSAVNVGLGGPILVLALGTSVDTEKMA
jgi:hypothetical protein